MGIETEGEMVDLPLDPAQSDDPNPPHETAERPTAAADADPEPSSAQPERVESRREAIIREMRERRAQEAVVDDSPEDLDTNVVPELQSAPEPAAIEAPVEQPKPEPVKRKLKVDGQEIEMTDDEIVRIAQQNIAADRRLADAKRDREEAARLLENARSAAPAYQPPQSQPAAEPEPEEDPAVRMRELLEVIRFGDDEEGANALLELQRMKTEPHTREEVDVRTAVQEALDNDRRAQATKATLEQFSEKHGDLLADEDIASLLPARMIKEMKADMLNLSGVSADDVNRLDANQTAVVHRQLREAGHTVRAPEALMEAAATDLRNKFQRPATREPETRQLASREDMKRALPGQPRAAGIRVELGQTAQQPRSRSDVVAAMKERTKGIPASSRR